MTDYWRLPFPLDLLGSTWPAHPLTEAEEAEALALGAKLVPREGRERWPVFNALIRQEIAALRRQSSVSAPTIIRRGGSPSGWTRRRRRGSSSDGRHR